MTAIHWFRRDLRLKDNAALYHALKSGYTVQCVFIFDKNILLQLEDKYDKRVDFIHQAIIRLDKELQQYGSSLKVYFDEPIEAWKEIITQFNPTLVFTNHDYEPYATKRDESIRILLEDHRIVFRTYKDQCIFEKHEVTKQDGKPYTVFTPYSKLWRSKINEEVLQAYNTESFFDKFNPTLPFEIPGLETIGFKPTGTDFPEMETGIEIIPNYAIQRDFPALNGTTHLGIHFRFGTISVREKLSKSLLLSEAWVNELIWRDFYMQILWHFPYVVKGPFKKGYDAIRWNNNEEEFQCWCEGKTGYPIVDAGMRQLNATGFMHNRVRMITASFLSKHLLINWQWGEAYFAKKLLDFDLSANNGGWQWAAGCGTDAAPYFRIFSPQTQTKRFDKDHAYIKTWIPELDTPDYPSPIVNHEFARKRCISAYKSALSITN